MLLSLCESGVDLLLLSRSERRQTIKPPAQKEKK
jgi:hypothetical protein